MPVATPANRRTFLTRSTLTTAAVASAASWCAPRTTCAPLQAAEPRLAPSDKLTLGIIGIGPRCTYDLKSILQFPDVQCVAIADVQSSRREAGKQLVDGHYGNRDCQLYRDLSLIHIFEPTRPY